MERELSNEQIAVRSLRWHHALGCTMAGDLIKSLLAEAKPCGALMGGAANARDAGERDCDNSPLSYQGQNDLDMAISEGMKRNICSVQEEHIAWQFSPSYLFSLDAIVMTMEALKGVLKPRIPARLHSPPLPR